MHVDRRPQLGALVVTPFVTIGVLAAVLMWEIEHVGSLTLALAIAAGGIAVGVVVARQLRRNMDRLADHYEALLKAADEASTRAETANRVKDEFLATLSHELRTPLNSILGWARLLGGGKLDPPQTVRAIDAIERAGWSQARLIEDLLDVSRIVAGKLQIAPRTAALQPLVESAVDSLRPAAAAKNLTVETSLDASLGPMTLDPDRIQQIVWNLLSNAIKFTPSGGRVSVSLRGVGDQVLLTVEDSGIGLEPEVAAHLFERFRQGDSSSTREFGGLGLGLGTVRHLAELHGGTVHAESAGANRGSRFQIRLPIRPAEQPRIDAPHVTSIGPSLKGISVLLVDDDPEALDFARSALEQCGAAVQTATSASEARERFSRSAPDVIVSDVMMPEADGFQLIREIRKMERDRGHRTPAVALTALARTDDRRLAFDAGFQMHVSKPIDPVELVVTVERLAHTNTARAAGGR